MRWVRWLMLGVIGSLPPIQAADTPVFTPEQLEFFEAEVRPLLVEHCHKCHGPEKQQADLRLDSRAALLKGGENGPVVVPAQPDQSRLIQAVRYTGDTQMPPDGPLSAQQIATLEKWVAQGAPWGADRPLPDAAKVEKQRTHWAFQPVKLVEPPATSQPEWCQTPIDAFILSGLQKATLVPSPPASRRELIRRVTYDLTGLPPSPEEVTAFEQDPDPAAYHQLVERLLDSPQYGEHWARHWLDVARYSDTKGYVYAREERFWVHAPTYRDWVIRAFQDDLPYNRFLTLQIAADQVAPDDPASQAAMGFLTLGRRFLGVTHDIYDDRIDVVTRGTMGLTVACARCHDHKYDPIPTADYYALYGVFLNSYEEVVPAHSRTELSEAERAVAQELATHTQKQAELLAAKRKEAADRLRQRIGDYLLAQTELTKYPQEGFDIILSTNDLIPALVWRWESWMAGEIHRGSPVWVPWQRFAAVPPEEFAARAESVLSDLQQAAPGTVHAQVVAALHPAPTSLREVAERYARLLTAVDAEWNASVEAARTAGTALPTQMPTPEAEALRQVLYGPGSPCELPDESIVSTETLYDSKSVDELWKQHNEIDQLLIRNPQATPHAVILKDRAVIRPNRILRRGNPATKTQFVERKFLTLLAGAEAKPFTTGSGRRELAEAIVDPANPLTARVWVNRLWQHHMGTGLVRTASDFGIRAENPSHPELLDWLATQLVASGWSTKAIHRLIVLSNTYQQSSRGPTDHEAWLRAQQTDPENRLLGRMNVHRLSWEEFRDTLLATSGQLERQVGGRATDLFSGGGTGHRRRTLYGTVDRQFLPAPLRIFDFANPDLHIPARSETTVPQQALFSLNHPLMADKARALVTNARLAEVDEPAKKLRRLYRTALQREPSASEIEFAWAFISGDPEPAPPPPSVESQAWSYGYGELDEAAGRLKAFTPLPYFNGQAWQGGPAWPDARLGWVQIHASGGHPGNDRQHAGIRRWTAPRAGTYAITSEANHEVAVGDGIRCWIISSRSGVLAQAAVHNRKQALNVAEVVCEAGDTLNFVVDLNADLNSEQHFWTLQIREVTSAPATTWDAQRDFTGPPPVTLTRWDQLAQVLLLTNELMFVD